MKKQTTKKARAWLQRSVKRSRSANGAPRGLYRKTQDAPHSPVELHVYETFSGLPVEEYVQDITDNTVRIALRFRRTQEVVRQSLWVI